MDAYTEITNRIIAELETGSIPWQKPWFGTGRAVKHHSGEPYSLLNEILLREPGEYASFHQIKAEGGTVRKGAKGRMVVFWKLLEVDDEATGEKKIIPLLKHSTVFRVGTDTEGIKLKYLDENGDSTRPATVRDDGAQAIFDAYLTRSGVRLDSDTRDEAYYSPSRDVIALPLFEQFKSAAEYYSTAFHEAVHSTGHRSRLNRFEANAPAAAFGSESYSKEELTAELGAAGILNELGIETAGSFRKSAAYIQSWLRALRNDKTMIVGAASRAQKAVDFIMDR